MGTIADKLNLLLNTKAAIKAAIIEKGPSVTDSDAFSAYPAKIQAIQTGVQLPSLTDPGTSADLLEGKQLIDQDGNLLDGTMPSLAAQTITPGVSDQVIAAGRYLAGAQTIKGDANLLAENIKSGVSIFDVDGAYAGQEPVFEDISSTSYVLSNSYYVYTITTSQDIDNLLGLAVKTANIWTFAYPYVFSDKTVVVGQAPKDAYTNCEVTISGNTITFKSASFAGDPGSIDSGTICYLPK